MDGLSVSKEAILAAMLETRIDITESFDMAFKGDSGRDRLRKVMMTTLECYEKNLKELLNLGMFQKDNKNG